jgi:uncharacterized protein YbjT (DUF2867 family)
MKITIFGGTGSVGKHLLIQLQKEGHSLTVLSRNPHSINNISQEIKVIQGDVTDNDAVRQAVKGHDAVVCLLGAPLRDRSLIRTKGTRVIVDAMKHVGVKRIVCLSAFGVGNTREYLPWLYRAFIAPFILNRVFEDHSGQEKILSESNLDFVIVRPGNFSETSNSKQYEHGRMESSRGKRLSLTITRSDLAQFIAKQISSDEYLNGGAWISYEK